MEDSSGETTKRYQSLFEEFQDAMAIPTREGEVVDVSRACLDLLGYDDRG